MKTTMRLILLFCAVFMASQPVLAQNDEDTRNKAVITTDDGDCQLITDEISLIRFDGSKVTVVQPWGETVFDRTLRSLTFLRPLPGTIRLTVNLNKDDDSGSTRGYSIDSDEKLASTWSSTDRVYVYANAISTTPIGTLSPVTYGTTVSAMTGNIDADGLSTGQTIFLSTQPRPYSFAAQSGEIGSTGLFYLTAEPTITITGANASVADATFEMAQAVVRFTLVRNTNGKALNIYGLTVEGGSETITVTPNQSNPPAQVYVGMPENTTSTTYYLTGVDGDDNEWTGTVTAAILAGHYYRANVTMTKKTVPTVTAPTSLSPTYNGSEQELVTAGSSTGGELQYSLTSGTGYSTDIPKATLAGDYTVYYKVVGDYTYTDVAESSVDVTIGKATYTVDGTATATAAYGTQVKDIAISGLTVKDVGGSTVAGSWAFTSTDVPSVGNMTAYTASFTPTSADDNYNALTMDITPVITAIPASVTAAPAAVTGDLTYNGSAQTLFNAGTSSDGTLKYKVTTTSDQPASTEGFSVFDESISQHTNAGTYYLWYYVDGDANHNDTDINVTAISKTIGKKAPTVADFNYTAPASLEYNGSAKLATVTAKDGITGMGDVTVKHYSGDTETTPTAVGVYTVKIVVDEGDNYLATSSELTDASWTFTITGAGSISYTTTTVNKTIGDAAFTNPLTKTGDGNVTYALTSGEEICAVDASTGLVTLNGTVGTCTITATVTNSTLYTYSPTTASYTLTVMTMQQAMLQTPLTFEAKEAGATVTFGGGEDPWGTPIPASVTIEYSQNGGEWEEYSGAITLSNEGDKVSFRGGNTSYWPGNKFSCSDDCYIYGNIMSLVSKEGYATLTELTGSDAFSWLFSENSNIFNHTSKTLVLPATTLSSSCYSYMFNGCTGLTTAPELPAETMAEYCYSNMFNGCTGLTTAPELPAETLAESCYENMFSGCTSLAQAPALPVETLAESCYTAMFSGCTNLTSAPALPAMTMEPYCYQGMFRGCISLTTAPALPATSLATQCYTGMFSGCTSLTSAPALPATTLAAFCYDGMFRSCTSLTTAPVLPATTLSSYCYQYMFQGCSNLNSVTCLATNITASNCTNGWLNGVATNGTFTKAAAADWSGKTGIHGIPDGWTVIPVVPGKFSVSASEKVYFSQGNLKYSDGTWNFHTNQYDMCFTEVGDVSASYNASGTFDLFGWGTSGCNSKYPYLTSTNDYDYYSGADIAGTEYDWGVHNTISGGTGWRTMTKDEWDYLLNTRTTTSGIRYRLAGVNDVAGIILLPDDWTNPYPNDINMDANSLSFSSTVWTNILEPTGAVFLPMFGVRLGTNYIKDGYNNKESYYWTSSHYESFTDADAYCVDLHAGSPQSVSEGHIPVRAGGFVRLVKDVE